MQHTSTNFDLDIKKTCKIARIFIGGVSLFGNMQHIHFAFFVRAGFCARPVIAGVKVRLTERSRAFPTHITMLPLPENTQVTV